MAKKYSLSKLARLTGLDAGTADAALKSMGIAPSDEFDDRRYFGEPALAALAEWARIQAPAKPARATRRRGESAMGAELEAGR